MRRFYQMWFRLSSNCIRATNRASVGKREAAVFVLLYLIQRATGRQI